MRNSTLAKGSLEPAWATFTIRMIGGSDTETAGNVFKRFEQHSYTLQLEEIGEPVRDVVIVDSEACDDYGIGGVLVVDTDDTGEKVVGAPEVFVPYDRIVSVGIY